MRKSIIFAVIAVMASLVSCQKENAVVELRSEELVFTATIENTGTKTTINANNSSSDKGKIYWSKDDEITITDNEKNAVVYEAQSYGSTTTTFKKKVTDPAQGDLGEGPYTATYKAAPSTSQSYSDYYSDEKVAKDLYMAAPSTNTRNFTFTAACGLLKINLTASNDESDKTISEIKIFGKVNSSDVIYTLTCSSAQSISSAKDFFIALPAGSYTVFKFTNSTGHICYKTAKSAIAIVDNGIQPVTLTGIVFNDMLPGKFTVNSSSKQVRFTKGNLYWNGSAFKLESSQTDYDKGTYDDGEETYIYTTTHVSHFFWSKTASIAYAEDYSDDGKAINDSFFFGECNSLTVDGQSGLYALSNDEWCYLLNYDPGESNFKTDSNVRQGKFKFLVTVNEVTNCLVIAPDGYTETIADSYDAAAWATAEASGLVCLPAAGHRDGSGLYGGGSVGYCWTATHHGSSETMAYVLYFEDGDVYPSSEDIRESGKSVRLVCSVSK